MRCDGVPFAIGRQQHVKHDGQALRLLDLQMTPVGLDDEPAEVQAEAGIAVRRRAILRVLLEDSLAHRNGDGGTGRCPVAC